MTTFWHGSNRIDGDYVLPSTETGVSRSGDHGVFVTTDRGLAATYAATSSGSAWVYEVEPLGDLEAIAPLIAGQPQVSFRCERARIVRRFTLSNVEREQRCSAVVNVGWGEW